MMRRQELLLLLQEMDPSEIRDVLGEYTDISGNRLFTSPGEEVYPPVYNVSMTRCPRDHSEVLGALRLDFPQVKPIDLLQELRKMSSESPMVLLDRVSWPQAIQMASRYRGIGCTVNIKLL